MDKFLDELIESVRAHSCLYDKVNVQYKNVTEKEKAWAEISEMCGRSKDECKRKWLTLRERFSKEEKKIDQPSGSGASMESEWPYYGSMQFLKQFIQPRRTRKNTFDSCESFEPEFDSTLEAPKKKKADKFDEACEAIELAAQRISSQVETPTNSRRKINQNFMNTICDLMESLPDEDQDTAMVQILQYVTDLKKCHALNKK